MLKFESNILYCFFNTKFYIDYLRIYTSAQKFLLIIEYYLIYYSLDHCFLFIKTFKLFNF